MVVGSRPALVIAWEWHIGLALLCGWSGALEYPTTNTCGPINKSLSLSLVKSQKQPNPIKLYFKLLAILLVKMQHSNNGFISYILLKSIHFSFGMLSSGQVWQSSKTQILPLNEKFKTLCIYARHTFIPDLLISHWSD